MGNEGRQGSEGKREPGSDKGGMGGKLRVIQGGEE